WIAAVVLGVVLAGLVAELDRRAYGYVERADDLLVTHGVFVRRLIVVPYGRMQFVDVTAGLLERWMGIATVRMHTAAAATDATIPSLPVTEAAQLRDRLAQKGEERSMGLGTAPMANQGHLDDRAHTDRTGRMGRQGRMVVPGLMVRALLTVRLPALRPALHLVLRPVLFPVGPALRMGTVPRTGTGLLRATGRRSGSPKGRTGSTGRRPRCARSSSSSFTSSFSAFRCC